MAGNVKKMMCAYCGRTLPWNRENFASTLYAECKECAANNEARRPESRLTVRALVLMWLERVLFPVKYRKINDEGELVRMTRRERRAVIREHGRI